MLTASERVVWRALRRYLTTAFLIRIRICDTKQGLLYLCTVPKATYGAHYSCASPSHSILFGIRYPAPGVEQVRDALLVLETWCIRPTRCRLQAMLGGLLTGPRNARFRQTRSRRGSDQRGHVIADRDPSRRSHAPLAAFHMRFPSLFVLSSLAVMTPRLSPRHSELHSGPRLCDGEDYG